MKGNVKVVVSTKKLHYELNLHRNITMLQGDSATGKTTLVQIISDYENGLTGPGSEVICEKKCVVLSGDAQTNIERLSKLSQAVVFVDEQERFLYSKEFAKAVLASDCYFVFVTREDLSMLPYSVTEIYELKNSGYYQNTRQVYNSLERVYPEKPIDAVQQPEVVLTEDSNAGLEMYAALLKETDMQCLSAGGKSNVAKYLLENKTKKIVAIVDGAAFGADMRGVMHALEINGNSVIWAPESFEYLILLSGIVPNAGLTEILQAPADYIESKDYASWERFFTKLLENITAGTIYEYSKNRLNEHYVTRGNQEKFKAILPEI